MVGEALEQKEVELTNVTRVIGYTSRKRVIVQMQRKLIGTMVLVCSLLLGASSFAEEVGVHIKEYGNAGRLSFGQVTNAAYYRVDWAPTVQGPWSGSWEGFQCVVPTNSGDVVLKVPHFYRVTAILKGYLDRPQEIDVLPGVDNDKLVLVPRGSNTCYPAIDPFSYSAGPAVSFTLDYDLWMGQHPITYSFYQLVSTSITARAYSMNPGYRGGAYPLNPSLTADNHPVTEINWYDALKFCNKLSELKKLAPVYHFENEVFASGEPDPDAIVINELADGFRLPKQLEWEYCARGGLQDKFYPWGDSIDSTYANYFYNLEHTTPVESYPKGISGGIGGPWDLLDVRLYGFAGNVHTILWDQIGDKCVYRANLAAGGNFNASAWNLQCSTRMTIEAQYKVYCLSFRICRSSR